LVCILTCGFHFLRSVDHLSDEDVIENTDPGPLLDVQQGDAKGDVDDATHGDGSDEDDSDEDDSDEDDSDQSVSDEDDSDESDSEEEDDSNGLAYVEFQDANEFKPGRIRTARLTRRHCEASYLPRHDKPRVKRRRVVHSESRSPSTEPPERPSAELSGSAVFTASHASGSTSAHVGRTATSTSTYPPVAIPRALIPPITQGTPPQFTPVENSPLTPASEAGTPSSLHEAHRERALAKRQLELSRAINRAAELEARNKINEIKQEIEFETKFGDVLGE
jgi:hypothetical protein